MRCTECNGPSYCSVEHLKFDRDSGSHACTVQGSGRKETKTLIDRFIKQHEIISEPEPAKSLKEMQVTTEDVQDNKYQDNGQKEDSASVLHNQKNKIDKNMYSFNERMRREPRQILRYLRLTDNLPDSYKLLLWVSESNIPNNEEFPHDCPYCKSPRYPELQILPQALNDAGKRYSERMELGALTIYTCGNSCTPKYTINGSSKIVYSTNWIQEEIWHQPVDS